MNTNTRERLREKIVLSLMVVRIRYTQYVGVWLAASVLTQGVYRQRTYTYIKTHHYTFSRFPRICLFQIHFPLSTSTLIFNDVLIFLLNNSCVMSKV